MKIIAYTNKGAVREHNEDVILAADNIISGQNMNRPIEINTENYNNHFAVIDGMGGYEGGEIAALIVAISFLENPEDWNNLNLLTSEIKNTIGSILIRASQKIRKIADNNLDLAYMGAALAGVVFWNEDIIIFNCGDCRVYYQKGRYLQKISHDHSLVQELFDKGKIEENDMRTHPRKNILTACVSANLSGIDIYFNEFSNTQQQNRFFICSDGVWEALSKEELEECLCNDYLATANNIVEKLSNAKCNDNVSFLIIGN